MVGGEPCWVWWEESPAGYGRGRVTLHCGYLSPCYEWGRVDTSQPWVHLAHRLALTWTTVPRRCNGDEALGSRRGKTLGGEPFSPPGSQECDGWYVSALINICSPRVNNVNDRIDEGLSPYRSLGYGDVRKVVYIPDIPGMGGRVCFSHS